VLWQRFIFLGQVDFMFGQPNSAKYLSDGQVKWEKVFCLCYYFIFHLDNQTQPTFEMTQGFKPFTVQRNKCADDMDNTNTMACPFGILID